MEKKGEHSYMFGNSSAIQKLLYWSISKLQFVILYALLFSQSIAKVRSSHTCI